MLATIPHILMLALLITAHGYGEESQAGYRVLWHAKEMNRYAGLPTKVSCKTDVILNPITGNCTIGDDRVEIHVKADGTLFLPWIPRAYRDNSAITWNRPKGTLEITTIIYFYSKNSKFVGFKNMLMIFYHMECLKYAFDQKRG